VLDDSIEDGSTLVVVQAIVQIADGSAFQEGDVVLDVVLNEDDVAKKLPVASELHKLVSRTLASRVKAFESKFEDTFQLSSKRLNDPSKSSEEHSALHFNDSHVRFAQAAFGNLIGGIGFFYGSSLVQHDPEKPSEVAASPVKPLFTAVPSRSFFPRGFLWDEGFHQLGIAPFDYRLTQDIVAHWLNLMEDDGYIAREQILGETARRRVPVEFLVQHVEHANPPTLLLAVEKIVQYGLKENANDEQREAELIEYVRLIFPFLERWYDWFVTTQRGPHEDDQAASMRWRGRNPNDGKLIANTLSSGLDDYPRASRPSAREMHVDLLSWMAKSSEIMSRLAKMSGLLDKAAAFEQERERYALGLDRYHWDEQLQSYFDIGEHSADGKIVPQVVIRCRDAQGRAVDATAPVNDVQRQRARCPASHPQYMFPLGDGRGGLQLKEVFIPETVRAGGVVNGLASAGFNPSLNDQQTKLQPVKHVGYVSIFPLLLKLLPPDSPRLIALLRGQILDPSHLWSPYGLRSMSTLDSFYERENAPGDNPYWRGSIWMNINYLALDALHHYAQPKVGSPFRKEFRAAYEQLRNNVISNIFSEYERTGYLWEQYSGDIHHRERYGRGQRCHPFSGWTALIVNIMAETY
jgi:mannosyl-oligosaccharide glucosidase